MKRRDVVTHSPSDARVIKYLGSKRVLLPAILDVITRELPSFGVWMLSSPAPIQLNGRNNVYCRPSCMP